MIMSSSYISVLFIFNLFYFVCLFVVVVFLLYSIVMIKQHNYTTPCHFQMTHVWLRWKLSLMDISPVTFQAQDASFNQYLTPNL